MLIICNGTFKSGSSWLHAVIVELLAIKKIPLTRVPSIYTNDVTSPTKIIESKLDKFIFHESYDKMNFITKAHFFKKNTMQSAYPDNVKFIFIERKMKDAIVSHFYHIKNKFHLKISFKWYYILIGKYKSHEIYLFNKRCKENFREDNFIYYHDLKNNFNEVVNKLCDILNIDYLNETEMNLLKKETTIESLRQKSKMGNSEYYPSKRKDNWKQFRQGEEGNWVNYFSVRHLSHINNIEQGNASYLFKIHYFFFFTLRRILFRIE